MPGAPPNDAPSAPPISQEERQTLGNVGSSVSRDRDPSQGVSSHLSQGSRGIAQVSIPFDAPPPSYQMAINCPTTPYPRGDLPPVAPCAGYTGYPPKPQPSYSIQHSQPPIYNATIGVSQVPQTQIVPPTQVVVAVRNGFICPHCNVGVITKETDMCCMLCLILLTIFTFPVGLIFLCCLPCTISRRCSNCRRTA